MTPVVSLQHKISVLEDKILALPQVDFKLLQWFEGSYYYRAIFIPKGHLLTGAKHRLPHECVCIGDILVSTDEGVGRITGYKRLWAEAGKKRVGMTLQDTIWLTIHWTDHFDLDTIEEWLSYPEEHAKLAAVKSRRLLASNSHELLVVD